MLAVFDALSIESVPEFVERSSGLRLEYVVEEGLITRSSKPGSVCEEDVEL